MDNKAQRTQELTDIREVLRTGFGRRLLYRILNKTGINQSLLRRGEHGLFEMYGDKLPLMRALLLDHGMWLNSEIVDADPELYDTMVKEGRMLKRALADSDKRKEGENENA